MVPRIGSVRLDRLSPAHIQKLYSDLSKSGGREEQPCPGRRSATFTGSCTTPSITRCAWGYIARNPTEAIDKPRDDTEERTVYTPDQTRRFLAGYRR